VVIVWHSPAYTTHVRFTNKKFSASTDRTMALTVCPKKGS